MWTVVFPKGFYDNLYGFLFDAAPYENGCFLLANSYKTKIGSFLLVTDAIRPTRESWNDKSERHLEPNSSFINRCVMAANSKNSGLIFVHTHPHSLHPSTFSWIDKRSNDEIFANLSPILAGRPLASLVFSRKGICGVVFNRNRLQDVKRIRIVGNSLIEFPGVGFTTKKRLRSKARFDRQIRAFGEQNQRRLQDLTVTIVGAGGTGSPTAVQLAKMGVKKLRLIDMDTVDKTNLPRIYGSDDKDIGRPKVDVLREHIKTFSKSTVDAICADIADKKIQDRLLESDIIIACTDNLTSRSILNDISYKYYIPLIDVGCRINLDDNNSIYQAIAKVQLVTPDSACLWCTNTLDGRLILQESYSKEQKARLAKEGYYEPIEKQPSIISLTTMAASMAVNKLLNLVGVFGEKYSPRTQIELKNGFMIDDRPEIKENCVCQKEKGSV